MDEQQAQADTPDVQSSKNFEEFQSSRSKCSEPGSVKIKKNTVSTRISARAPPSFINDQRSRGRSASSPSSDFIYDEASATSSSNCTSTPISKSTLLVSERTDESNGSRPNYMNMTQSIKAKQKGCNLSRAVMQRNSSGEFQFNKKMTSTYIDSRSSERSDPSISYSRPLSAMPRRDRSSVRNMEKENYYYDERPASVF